VANSFEDMREQAMGARRAQGEDREAQQEDAGLGHDDNQNDDSDDNEN
jgi:hypothetical protein